MKACTSCKVEKPLTDFDPNKLGKLGLHSQCIPCRRAATEAWRKRNLSKRAADLKAWREKSNGAYIKSNRDWELRNKEKRAAHVRVKWAKKKGLLIPKPCRDCGTSKVEAHHEDYSKPLEVVWLCKRCHCALHASRESMRA